MTRIRPQLFRRTRRGFTLIELLVVISIIAVLASLIAPAVQSARRAARKAECQNNIRQVSLAIQNFSSSNGNGTLPWLATSISNTAGSGSVPANWVVQILPAFENSALLKSIKANGLGGVNDIVVNGLTCPDDMDSHKINGGLSYVVNIGHISSNVWTAATTCTEVIPAWTVPATPATTATFWTTSTWHNIRAIDGSDSGTTIGDQADEGINQASGVFVRDLRFAGSTAQPSLDYISTGDGTTSTIMLAENMNAGRWDSTVSTQVGFGVRVVLGSNGRQNNDYSAAASSLNPGLNFGTATAPGNADFLINRNSTTTTIGVPRASSNHVGGVNVVMCDGSTRFIAEGVDAGIWGRLITSNGVTHGETVLNQGSF